jgi:hypothetical protein
MTWSRATVTLAIVAGSSSPPLTGQRLPVASPQTANITPRAVLLADTARLGRLLNGIHRGVVLRVSMAHGSRISGRHEGWVGDAILLRTDTAAIRIPAMLIDSLWTRRRSIVPKAIHGAEVGALFAAGLVLSRTFRVACHSSTLSSYGLPFPDCRATAGRIGRAAAMGAVGGGGVGIAIGVAFPRWELGFP